ncbi:MAG: ABC transporter permease [Chloroflexota bacterium]|nr:ABC transporter permease [Chloroflexota bacterium]
MAATSLAGNINLATARPSQRRRQLVRISQQKGIVIGGLILIVIVVAALLAPLLTTHDPELIVGVDRLQGPSREHPFGTDGQGRDVYSRVIYGARLSLGVGFAVSIATVIAGTAVGLIAGYYRRIDGPIMRVMDGMMAFPGIILAIGIMAVRGAQISNIVLALTVVYMPRLARIIRSIVLGFRESQFVEAAQAIGALNSRVLWRHILPNCAAPLIVQASFVFAEAIIGEATLSFLGAGASPGIPSWGVMLNESKGVLRQAPWSMLFPGIALTLTVFALNLLGDGLRDLLDPRLRHR